MTERPRLGLAALLFLTTGCAPIAPSATPVQPSSAPATASPNAAASRQPSPAAIALPEAGRPFDAATLLAAMRDSRRPGGVPDEIETDVIASALADAIWTIDGQPWTTTAAGGSCGPETCTLEMAGVRDGFSGDDLWAFTVTPESGSVEVLSAEVRSLPAELAAAIDELIRSLDGDGSLAGMLMASLKWLPPPDGGPFVASYRSGGEEGSCAVDITFDAAAAAIVSEQSLGC